MDEAMTSTPRELLGRMFAAAVKAAQPSHCIPRFLPRPPLGRTLVIGAGKASAAMAQALERNWPGELTGLVVTRYGYAVPCERIEIVEAAHPARRCRPCLRPAGCSTSCASSAPTTW